MFIGRTDVEAETLILWPPDAKSRPIWKDPDPGKHWRQEEKGQQRMRWLDDITDSVTQWTWVCVNSGSWWWPGMPGMLQFMGSQRVRHNWATELNWLILHSADMGVGEQGGYAWILRIRHGRSKCPRTTQVCWKREDPSPQVSSRWPHRVCRTPIGEAHQMSMYSRNQHNIVKQLSFD